MTNPNEPVGSDCEYCDGYGILTVPCSKTEVWEEECRFCEGTGKMLNNEPGEKTGNSNAGGSDPKTAAEWAALIACKKRTPDMAGDVAVIAPIIKRIQAQARREALEECRRICQNVIDEGQKEHQLDFKNAASFMIAGAKICMDKISKQLAQENDSE